MYLWSQQYCRQADFKHEFHINGNCTDVDWKDFLHDVCAEHFNRNLVVNGGVGHTVEIHECMLVRQKYHRGHRVQHQWVFGGVDISTTEGFMIPVENRDATTLLPIIQQHILPDNMLNYTTQYTTSRHNNNHDPNPYPNHRCANRG